MIKTLRKRIMIRYRLKYPFNKTRSDTKWSLYKMKRNFSAKLLKKAEKDYFSKVNPKLLSDNNLFSCEL